MVDRNIPMSTPLPNVHTVKMDNEYEPMWFMVNGLKVSDT